MDAEETEEIRRAEGPASRLHVRADAEEAGPLPESRGVRVLSGEGGRVTGRGRLVSYLEQRGWHRINLPAEDLNECGAETEISICSKIARWERYGPSRGPLCAQHAASAQSHLDRGM